jgi:chromosome segregation ATPase
VDDCEWLTVRAALCSALQPSKKDRPRMSVEKVDERIHSLEHRRNTESLSLKEEKELMSEIKALKTSRAGIAGYDDTYKALGEQRASNDAKRKELKTGMDALDKEIDALTEEKNALSEKLEKSGVKIETNIPELAKERDAIRAEVTKLYDSMRAMRDKYKKDNDLWWESEKVYRDQERKERQIKWEEDRKQKLIDDELYRKEMFESEQSDDSDPFTEQKIMISEVKKYLASLIDTNEKVEEVVTNMVVEGEQTIGKKSNMHDEESWGGLEKKKGKKGKKKRGTSVKKDTASLSHPPTKIAALSELDIPLPTTIAAVQASIDACDAKSAEIEEKSKKMPEKVKKVYIPRKIALRIQPKGEKDIKVSIDCIELPA